MTVPKNLLKIFCNDMTDIIMTRFFDWFQLIVLACLLCLGFGRALLLRRRGIRVLIIDARHSPTEAIVDLLFPACAVLWVYETLAYTVPLATHLVPPSVSPPIIDGLAFKVAGMFMSISGLVIYGLALRTLGKSWRIGIDTERPGPLVTNGIFAWSRNPIYVALDLLAVGAFLVIDRLVFLVLALVIAGMFHRQIHKEEDFLAGIYGETYKNYCTRVGRYVKVPPKIISALPRRWGRDGP